MAYASPEKAAEYQRRWRQTPAGRASRRRTVDKHHATERYRETLRTYRESPQGKAVARRSKHNYRSTPGGFYRYTRDRALHHGIEFTLTEEEFLALLAPMRCAVTGMPLEIRPGEPRYLLSPSLDRLDGSKGYAPGNVHCVALWVNFARGSAPLDDIKAVLYAFKAQEHAA